MNSADVIAAIASPHGKGGIAVVRVSGLRALDVVLPHLSVSALKPQHATHCYFDDIDDGLATYTPTGYTGEPTVEFSCHGSTYVQQAIMAALIGSGARLAGPGEYTMRAFLNGRLNLSQAEAVADLIDSTTPAQHRLAVGQLRGGYARRLEALRGALLNLTALLELELDFSQEDVEFADRTELQHLVSNTATEVRRLLHTFALGNAVRRGVPVAIVGSPNVGKSTLLNALLGDDRAIVSPIPGTTRDTIDGTLTIGGLTFRFVDTAGRRDASDPVEQLGIERSRRAEAEAMVVLHVYDASARDEELPWPEADGKSHILVLNKSDLCTTDGSAEPEIQISKSIIQNYRSALAVSALTGAGIDDLKQAIASSLPAEAASADEVLSNLRHREALQRVAEALGAVAQGLADALPADLVAIDLRDALHHLGTITGEVTTDEVLGTIFSRFCVGK